MQHWSYTLTNGASLTSEFRSRLQHESSMVYAQLSTLNVTLIFSADTSTAAAGAAAGACTAAPAPKVTLLVGQSLRAAPKALPRRDGRFALSCR